MTTIAYAHGVIAYDSRCTANDTIADDKFNKHRCTQGVHFFFCGNTGDIDLLIKMYFGGRKKPTDACEALVWDGRMRKLLSIGWEDKWFTSEESLDVPCAFGSGEHHAITAIDCGLSAKDAVKMAIKRDTGSGGKVRTFKIPGYGKV